jgi:hypothetical protein
MGTNRYFSQFIVGSEQELFDSLFTEAIQIAGVDWIYLPRQYMRLDPIYGEDVLSFWNDYHDIEIYISSNNYEGNQEIMTKFGLMAEHELKIQISRSRFDEVTRGELQHPLEGDLFYDPYTTSLWEIKFVEDNSILPQFGDIPLYEISLARYVYSQESIRTGLREIDEIETTYSIAIAMDLQPGVGNFVDGEWIYQGTSLSNAIAKAEIKCWDSVNNQLQVINIFGEFDIINGPIIGNTSLASRTLLGNPDQIQDNRVNDISDNSSIETEASSYLDFSESDIFGFLKDQ